MKTTITGFKPIPPEPTFENPHAQIDWIWKRFCNHYRAERTKEVIQTRLAAYKRFLRKTNGDDDRLKNDPRFYLAVNWDNFAILRAKQYWCDMGYTTNTIYGNIKTLKNVMDFAAAQNLTPTNEFMYPKIKVERETKAREAYSDKEISLIRKVISQAVEQVNLAVKGYNPVGVGSDPRGKCGKPDKNSRVGWKYWENMVWYFEKVMNCTPRSEFEIIEGKARKIHRHFFVAANVYHGGINKVWERLEVPPYIGSDLVVALAMKLAWETGLNSRAILDLKRDCYQEEHPLSGQPFIRYYKERSSGEKNLQLALFDGKNEAKLLLQYKQSEVIRRTIDLILNLTQPLVEKALPADKDYLLLYEISGSRASHISKARARRVSKDTLCDWSKKVRDNLKKTTGETLEFFNLARFRATKITQMVLDGHDFFQIQAVAGHSSAVTTARYLSSFQLEPKAKAEVTATLIRIQRNAQDFNENPKPYAQSGKRYDPSAIYKGVISDCKNPFAPPKSVQRLKSYRTGELCTYWNMCLLCPNVIITKKHLPLLIGYANEVDNSLKNQNLTQISKGNHYEKVHAVLCEIFREFPEKDLKRAADIAESADIFADGMTYRGVKN